MPTTERTEPDLPEPNSPKEGRWIARPKKSRWLLKLGIWGGFIGQVPNLVDSILKGVLGEHAGRYSLIVFVASALALGIYFSVREWLARRMRA